MRKFLAILVLLAASWTTVPAQTLDSNKFSELQIDILRFHFDQLNEFWRKSLAGPKRIAAGHCSKSRTEIDRQARLLADRKGVSPDSELFELLTMCGIKDFVEDHYDDAMRWFSEAEAMSAGGGWRELLHLFLAQAHALGQGAGISPALTFEHLRKARDINVSKWPRALVEDLKKEGAWPGP